MLLEEITYSNNLNMLNYIYIIYYSYHWYLPSTVRLAELVELVLALIASHIYVPESESAALEMSNWLVRFWVPDTVDDIKYLPVPLMSWRVWFSSCLYHVMIGLGNPLAEQVKVALANVVMTSLSGCWLMNAATTTRKASPTTQLKYFIIFKVSNQGNALLHLEY